MSSRVILHSDINSCYASIEHLHHPELNGKPLAVGCRTDFADIQNKKECGGNRQWQNHYLRNWAADMSGKEIT